MSKIRVGMRVMLARTREGEPVTLELPAVVQAIVFGKSDSGVYYDTLICLGIDVMTQDGSYGYRKGQTVGVLFSQLEPMVPEGAQPSSWEECLWNPSMIKENNE